MGDIYAVQVMKGQELQVKENILNFLEYHQMDGLVQAVHAFETLTRKVKPKTSKSESLSVFKSAFGEGYLFIELTFSADTRYQRLPARLWHIIKSVPKVFKILDYTVPREEFERLCENLDVEPQVEVSSEAKVVEVDEKELLHKANTTKDPHEAKEINKKLDNINSITTPLLHKVEQVIEKAKDANETIQRTIDKCKAFIRRKRETFLFPVTIFLKARKKIDPMEQMTVCEMKEGDLIIHAMIDELQREVALE